MAGFLDFKLNVTKPGAGQARIVVTDKNGTVTHDQTETDAAKADALTDALTGAGKLGVDIGPAA